jgi:RNA polymerase sigma factor (TIGR02999 family)
MSNGTSDLTVLFARLRAGDEDALGRIMDALYSELHALAVRRMRAEARRHTLQATALVHEAYLRLMHGPAAINDRRHFFALAARAMRRVLVDYARQKRAGKRGGRMERVTLELAPGFEPLDVDVLALDEALDALASYDARAARAAQVVELRFFGGHTDKEVSEILGEKVPTIRRDWDFARAWLRTQLAGRASA